MKHADPQSAEPAAGQATGRRTAREIQIEIFRRMTPQQRLECAFRWTNLTLEFCRAGIRSDHPDWSPERIEREVFRRATGIDLDRLVGPLNENRHDGREASSCEGEGP